MPRRWVHSFCIAVTLAVAASAEDFINADALNSVGMVKYWQLKLPLAKDQTLADCYLVDDHIYAATHDGYVFSLDAKTGAVLWLKRVTTGGYRIWAPCHAGDRVLFVTPAEMRQYDRHYGDALRSLKFEFPAGAPAVCDGRRYYVGGIDQRVYALVVDWRNKKDNEFGDYPIWKFATRSQVISRPVLFGEYIAVAGDDGRVYACRTLDKAGLWVTGLGTSVTADLVSDEKGIYVACRDQSLYMLEPNTGKVVWRERLAAPLAEPPVITPERAYQFSEADGIAAIRSQTALDSDRIVWKLPSGRKLLTAGKDRGLFLSRHDTLLDVQLDNGNVIHEVAAPGLSICMPTPNEAVLYLASNDGRIFCARPVGTAPLTARDVMAAQVPPNATAQAAADAAAIAGAATSQPAKPEAAKPAASASKGTNLGGKSKVSRDFKGE